MAANPVWVREMQQAARLGRTPYAIASLTALTAFVVASAGAIASDDRPSASVGMVLYHTFFSLAFAVVAWVGPGIAAMTIASERSGQTWEPLLLTGMGPRAIARGKFLASLTYMALYLVALAPVGAIPFLFGGVTAIEVALAFGLLAAFAVVFVGFGLSVSSALSSPGLAAVVTLPIAVALSISIYGSLGVGLSFVASELWPSVVGGGPVWLPTAYVRAPFSWSYVVYLLVVPIGSIALLSWFFFENTVTNLRDESDDRTSGLKRWFLVTVPCVVGMAMALGFSFEPSNAWVAPLLGMLAVDALTLLGVFLFAGDALEPSERVKADYGENGPTLAQRLLGPGIVTTMTTLMAAGLCAWSVLLVGGGYFEVRSGAKTTSDDVGTLMVVAAYSGAFLVFLCGLTTWLRSLVLRGRSSRLWLALVTFFALVGPWIAAALGSAVWNSKQVLLIAGVSPLYSIVMAEALDRAGSAAELRLWFGALAMVAWTITGLTMQIIGARRITLLKRAFAERRRRMERGEVTTESTPPETGR